MTHSDQIKTDSAHSDAVNAGVAPGTPIRGGIELPALREEIELHTGDGLTLVGELALPVGRPPVATLVTLHPLPTAGGFMDSHILRKAAARLPALADLAVLRFNTRGTSSPRGTSDGSFGEGIGEQADVAAAMAFVAERGLPNPWLLGWSFGTELAIKYGLEHPISGAILLSPPLHRASSAELGAWAGSGTPLIALIPEFDDYLRPAEAAERFAVAPDARLINVEGGKHLWVGEKQTARVLAEIVDAVNPAASPLSEVWPGTVHNPTATTTGS
ncbi:alpha/beta hydrolase [Microterricola viridarii]|uniref:Alpha/beta hydrolase n=1 Tax=Microterricola viridarii TaxID=412690 RepID=A0A120I033_9MICO|nr:alpha/beta hydrolase [Microterricola viridarii]AMB58202.1 alpha/beta hydrolase [Microterricola viridarii]